MQKGCGVVVPVEITRLGLVAKTLFYLDSHTILRECQVCKAHENLTRVIFRTISMMNNYLYFIISSTSKLDVHGGLLRNEANSSSLLFSSLGVASSFVKNVACGNNRRNDNPFSSRHLAVASCYLGK